MSAKRLEELDYESLAGLVRAKFRLRLAPDEVIELELVETTPRRVNSMSGKPPAAYESFSLIFLGPVNRLLPQSIYSLESESLGTLELFIVPIGRDANGIRYEAAFNRQTKAG